MARRDLWITSHDGLTLHAVAFEPAAPSGRLPALCLPGLTRNVHDFEAFATALASGPDARRVIVLEARGRGQSARDPNPANYTPAVEMQDVLTLFAAARLDRAALIGTSRGGLVAMMLAASQPARVGALVLNDIGPVIEMAGLLRIKGYVGAAAPAPTSWAEAGARAAATHAGQFPQLSDADWIEMARGTWRETDGRFELSYDARLADGLATLDPATPAPTLWPVFEAAPAVPMMVVRGALSDILSAETVAAMRARRPDLLTLTAADQGHAPALAHPDVLPHIRRFLAVSDAVGAGAA